MAASLNLLMYSQVLIYKCKSVNPNMLIWAKDKVINVYEIHLCMSCAYSKRDQYLGISCLVLITLSCIVNKQMHYIHRYLYFSRFDFLDSSHVNYRKLAILHLHGERAFTRKRYTIFAQISIHNPACYHH